MQSHCQVFQSLEQKSQLNFYFNYDNSKNVILVKWVVKHGMTAHKSNALIDLF